MNKIKYIICLVTAVLWMAAASAQTFYYNGDEKEPLHVYPGRKVILCNNPQLDPMPPHSADKVIKEFRSNTGVLKIYEENNSGTQNRTIPSSPSYSIYDCYGRGNMEVPTGVLDVELKTLNDTILLKKICSDYHCSIIKQNRHFPLWFHIRMIPGDGRSPVQTANSMYETGYFLSVIPELWVENMKEISYDPFTTNQWALYNYKYPGVDISVSRAWNYSTGRNIKIGLLDGGTDIYHEDLFRRIYKSYDANTQSSPCNTQDDHGTRCAGIAAATRNNNKGISGVAPDALLMPVSVQMDSLIDTSVFIEAID